MNLVRTTLDEIPTFTLEYLAEVKALAEAPDSEIDLSDMPELDEFDFQYSVPFAELMAMTDVQRSELARKLLAAKEAARAAIKARQEAEQAIAEIRRLAHQA